MAAEEHLFAGGIAKINIATDLYVTTTRRLAETIKAERTTYFDVIAAGIASFQERCGHYLDLFGATGKAV